MNYKALEKVVILGIVAVVGVGFSPAWTQSSAKPNGIAGMAMSVDGRVICAASSAMHPIVSTNGGGNWSTNTTANGYFGVAASADGTKLMVTTTEQALLMSTNSGASWFSTASPSADWRGLAASADGTKWFAAILQGFIIYSTNSGTNWATNGAPSKPWVNLTVSADGKKLLATTSVNQIFASTNMGTNWTQMIINGNSIAISADGSGMLVLGNGCYVSSDNGNTWATNTAITGTTVATTANGAMVFVAGANSGNTFYYSSDYGVTWATNTPSLPVVGNLVCSADGSKLAAKGAANTIVIGTVQPAPQLDIKATNGSLAFSWICSTTNFALQQSTDLTATSWNTVTNVPVFNLANLQEQTSLSSSNDTGFFRLISQ